MLYVRLRKSTIQKALQILHQMGYSEQEANQILDTLYQIASIMVEQHRQQLNKKFVKVLDGKNYEPKNKDNN